MSFGKISAAATTGAGAELVREIFQSAAAREKQEYERKRLAIEAFKQQEARKAEAENRRRQDARVGANSQVNSIVGELRKFYGDTITKNLLGAMQKVDEAVSRISTGNAET